MDCGCLVGTYSRSRIRVFADAIEDTGIDCVPRLTVRTYGRTMELAKALELMGTSSDGR